MARLRIEGKKLKLAQPSGELEKMHNCGTHSSVQFIFCRECCREYGKKR